MRNLIKCFLIICLFVVFSTMTCITDHEKGFQTYSTITVNDLTVSEFINIHGNEILVPLVFELKSNDDGSFDGRIKLHNDQWYDHAGNLNNDLVIYVPELDTESKLYFFNDVIFSGKNLVCDCYVPLPHLRTLAIIAEK